MVFVFLVCCPGFPTLFCVYWPWVNHNSCMSSFCGQQVDDKRFWSALMPQLLVYTWLPQPPASDILYICLLNPVICISRVHCSWWWCLCNVDFYRQIANAFMISNFLMCFTYYVMRRACHISNNRKVVLNHLSLSLYFPFFSVFHSEFYVLSFFILSLFCT